MPREPDTFAYYAVKDENGLDVVCHAIVGKQPEDAVLITKEQADVINAAVDARSPKVVRPVSASGSPDLSALLEQMDKMSKTLILQAQALDEANSKIEDANTKIASQANDISKVRDNTAKAIAQMTEGIGEKGA